MRSHFAAFVFALCFALRFVPRYVLRAGFVAGLLYAGSAAAVIETYEFSAPQLEERYRELSQELRCPKCQNQNIADSNAPISQDLRALLYEQLEAGASNEAILADMVARYGEFVRYRPDARGATLWLWLAPALMLVGGLCILALLLMRGRRPADVSADSLTPEERRRVEQLTATQVEEQ